MRNRNRRFSLWLNEREFAHMEKQAQNAGMKKEPYLRDLIMNRPINPRPPDEYGKILRELSAIGNNVNQIARVANSLGRINYDELQKIQLSLDHIWKEVKKL